MARTFKTSTTKYAPKRVKGFFGRAKTKLKPVSKKVTKKTNPRKLTELEVIDKLRGKDKVDALKARRKSITAQTVGAGAETASSAITMGVTNQGPTTQTANNYGSNNLQQNVSGGISQSGNRRDDDDEEDFPGVN
jgi:hypothetical protein